MYNDYCLDYYLLFTICGKNTKKIAKEDISCGNHKVFVIYRPFIYVTLLSIFFVV